MTLTLDGAIEAAEQLDGMWTALVEDVGKRREIEDGVLRLWADCAFSFYNTLAFATPVSDVDDLRARLGTAARFMRSRDKPGLLWLFEELLAGDARVRLDEVAAETGLAMSMKAFGMAGPIPIMEEPTHPELRFERVETQTHLDDFAAINAHAYGMDVAGAREAFHDSTLWREGIHAWIGYRGEEPVCCAGTAPVDGRLFVILVATEPRWHRHGFGEAVTRKAIWEGARATGLTRMTLHGTEAGRPVYERIGFAVTSMMRFYGPLG